MTDPNNEAGRINRDPAEGGKSTVEEAIKIQSRDLPGTGDEMKPVSEQADVQDELSDEDESRKDRAA